MDHFTSSDKIYSVKKSIALIKSLSNEQKLALAAIQIAIWLGLSGIKDKVRSIYLPIKLNVITYAIEAIHKYVTGETCVVVLKSGRSYKISDKVKALIQNISNNVWEPLCNEDDLASSTLSKHCDPLSLISFICIRIVLNIIKNAPSDSNHRLICQFIQKDPNFEKIREFRQARGIDILKHMFDKTGLFPKGYELMGKSRSDINQNNLIRLMNITYNFADDNEFRNHLGFFSIIDKKEMDPMELSNIFADEFARRNAEYINFENAPKRLVPDEPDDISVTEDTDKKKRSRIDKHTDTKAETHAIFFRKLSPRQLHDATLISQINDTFKTKLDLLQLLFVMQRRFLKSVTEILEDGHINPQLWGWDEICHIKMRDGKVKPHVQELALLLHPYWNGILNLTGLNITNYFIFLALQISLTDEVGLYNELIRIFSDKWNKKNSSVSKIKWSRFSNWGPSGLGIAGFCLFFEIEH